jgi:hypothetical protein
MDLKYTIETLKEVIEKILRTDERARDDDLWLYLQVLMAQGHKIHINFDELDSMPRPESVSRVRRCLQNNEQKYTPSEQIAQRRVQLREESVGMWRNSQYF